MARSLAWQQLAERDRSAAVNGNGWNIEDSWPEEPTAVDPLMTMEELILDELRRQGAALPPPEPAKKGTHAR